MGFGNFLVDLDAVEVLEPAGEGEMLIEKKTITR